MKFIILVSNLKEISPSVLSWKKNNIYIYIYKKLRCNSTVKIRFGLKNILNYAYVLKNGVDRYNIFFNFYTKLAEFSFLCRFRIEPINVFILPRFDLCHVHISFINKQFRTCASASPNEFTVRSYEYCAGTHWMLYWMQENQTATYFLRSRLFTYAIMKNFNCN
jgi:hypothetical protein